MPFSHSRGGLKRPLPCIGGFTVNRFTVDGFTLNRFTVNGFTVNGSTPPGDALGHVHSLKPFRMRRYEKCARNSRTICTYKNKGLKLPWNQHLQKGGWHPPPCLPSLLTSWPPMSLSACLLSATGFTISSPSATRGRLTGRGRNSTLRQIVPSRAVTLPWKTSTRR